MASKGSNVKWDLKREINLVITTFLDPLCVRIHSLKDECARFKRVSNEYEAFILSWFHQKPDLAQNSNLKQVLLNWLRSFVSAADECQILYTGGFMNNSYLAHEHRNYRDNRGHNNGYYKFDSLSKMSCDGVDFQFGLFQERVAAVTSERQRAELEDLLEVLPTKCEPLATAVTGYIRELETGFWTSLERVLINIGATDVVTVFNSAKHGSRSGHMGEYITVVFQGNPPINVLKLERKDIPAYTREMGMSAVADLDVDVGAGGSKKRVGRGKRVVVDDDDDEEDAPLVVRQPEVTYDVSLNRIREVVNEKYHHAEADTAGGNNAQNTTSRPRRDEDSQEDLVQRAEALLKNIARQTAPVAVAADLPPSVEEEWAAPSWGDDCIVIHPTETVTSTTGLPSQAQPLDRFQSCPPCVVFLQQVGECVGQFQHNQAQSDPHHPRKTTDRAQLEMALFAIVEATCVFLTNAHARSQSHDDGPAALALDYSRLVLVGSTGSSMHELYGAVMQRGIAASREGCLPPPPARPVDWSVDLSGVHISGETLARAMLSATTVIANGCECWSHVLATAVRQIREDSQQVAGMTEVEGAPRPSPSLSALSMQSNRFVGAGGRGEEHSPLPHSSPPAFAGTGAGAGSEILGGTDCPWFDFIDTVLSAFPALSTIDLSYCAASEGEWLVSTVSRAGVYAGILMIGTLVQLIVWSFVLGLLDFSLLFRFSSLLYYSPHASLFFPFTPCRLCTLPAEEWTHLTTGLYLALVRRQSAGLRPLEKITIRGLDQAWAALSAALDAAVCPALTLLTDFRGIQRALVLQM